MVLGIGLGVIVVAALAYVLVALRSPEEARLTPPATKPTGSRGTKSTESAKDSVDANTSASAKADASESGSETASSAKSTGDVQASDGDAPSSGSSRGDENADVPDDEDDDQGMTVMTRKFAQTEHRNLFQQDINSIFPDTEEEDADPTTPFALFLVSAIGQTDVGKRRKHNEDNYLILPDQHLFVIADGMGGHAAGEVASALAVETIEKAFKTRKFDGEPAADRPKRGDELVRSIDMANKIIYDQATLNPEQSGMGTTIVSARYSPNKHRVYIAHVGDSRLYRLRGNDLVQMTTDHTLESQGVRGPEAAKLTRAVGIDPTVLVDLMADEPVAGDMYLLCSDGLTKMLDDGVIRDTLVGETDIQKSVQNLIERANDSGGRDNITVIVVRVVRPDAGGSQA